MTSRDEKEALVKRLTQWERGVKFGDESDIPLDSISLLKLLSDCIAALERDLTAAPMTAASVTDERE